MMDGTMIEGAEAPVEQEKETTVQCPNCGAMLKIEVEEPEAVAPEVPVEGPSIRDALGAAMGGGGGAA